jgi:hypothetical protein
MLLLEVSLTVRVSVTSGRGNLIARILPMISLGTG